MKKHVPHTLMSSLSLIPLLLTAGAGQTAFAADDSKFTLEEVVVTARRREESLLSVPVAVTAFSGEELDKIGAMDITDLAQSTPNTTLKVSRGTNSTITAFIRGVGQQDPVAGFEAGVGIYLDGVYLNRPQGAVLQIYDVARIEVLRGPQGTLYGRNTIGGAIKYVTRRFGNEPELRIKVAGGNYNHLDGVVTASTPLSDTIAVGGSVAYFSRDGFGTNLFNGKQHYDKDIFGARLGVEFTPNENFFLRISGDYTRDSSNEKSGHRLTVSNNTHAPILKNVYDTRAGITGKQLVTQGGVSAEAEWTLNETVTLKSTTAYRKDDTQSPIDFDSLPANDFDVPVVYRNDQFSQEFQLLYESDTLHGILGFYYLNANAFDNFDVILGGLGVTSTTLGDVNTKTWAIFGEATYDLSDTVSVTVGGRFTSDKRRAKVVKQLFLGIGSPDFGNNSAILLRESANFTGRRKDTKFTPKVSLEWHPTDDMNLYASFSQGFKGGGFDPRGSNLAKQGFNPETVNSYEAGLKSKFADGRVNTNIAVFYSDYKDIQIPGSVGIDTNGDGIQDDFVGTTTNAGKAKIWGIEFEGMALVSENLTAKASGGYINADYKTWIVKGVNIASTKVFQNTPKWNGSFSLDYQFLQNMFGHDGSIDLIGSVSYKSKTFIFENPIPLLDQDGYAVVDASIVWTSEDGGVQVGIHGKNLTDKKYKVAGYNFPTLGLEGVVSAFYGNPLTVTGTVDLKF